MELIYAQTRVKGPGSSKLALEMEKIKIEILQFLCIWYRHYTNVFMNDFGLDRYKLCWRL